MNGIPSYTSSTTHPQLRLVASATTTLPALQNRKVRLSIRSMAFSTMPPVDIRSHGSSSDAATTTRPSPVRAVVLETGSFTCASENKRMQNTEQDRPTAHSVTSRTLEATDCSVPTGTSSSIRQNELLGCCSASSQAHSDSRLRSFDQQSDKNASANQC